MKILSTEKAPSAVGPYSQGIEVGNLVFTSGQLPIDMSNGQLSTGDIERETRLCIENANEVLKSAGTSIEKAIKVTVFVTDINDFGKINDIYAEYFSDHKPARSLVEVSKLPKGANIEIEMIAEK